MRRIFRSGGSSRNVLTLVTGTAMAQAIPVGISPILTRLYTPSDMGLLALFMALSAIPAAIASGRYELAIQLVDDDEDAINVAALSLLIAGSVAGVLLLVSVILGGPIAQASGNEDIRPWLYLVPLSVLLTATFTVLTYLNSRAKQFRDVATSSVVKSIVMAALQLAGGALKAGAAGLIVGHVASLVAGNGRLSRNATRGRTLRSVVSRERMKRVAKRHARLPAFLLPSTLANTLANNFSSVLIAGFYSTATLGFYALGQRALGAPLQLLGNAIGQVFFQRASEAKRTSGSAYPEMRRARNALLAGSVIIFVPLYLVAEPLFALVFGETWRTAGTYAQLLIPMIAARFVASPLVLMSHVNERHGAHLVFNLALLGATILVIVGAGQRGFSPERVFMVLGLVNAALYLGLMMYVVRTARRSTRAAADTIRETG